jgi:hypothetical protein
MPIPVENIKPLSCYRVSEGEPRRVLLIHEGIVTYVLRGNLAWTVHRYRVPLAGFAELCEAEIDLMTLQDLVPA